MKYLVLGSEGQIGSALTAYLKSKNHEVIEFDITNSPEQDLRLYQNHLLENVISNCDFIFFLAWDVGGSRYLKKYQDTTDFIFNNLKIILYTFEIIKKYNKPFIFSSSQMASMSHSSYGLTKHLAEKIVEILNGITVKFWNVYGPEKDFEKSHVITDFILKAKNNQSIQMLTNGLEERQFLHVDDCSECLYILSQKYNILDKNKEYHITSFCWTKIIDIANIIQNNFQNVEIIIGEESDSVQLNTKNEPDTHILNYWQPKISIKDGIKKVITCMESQ